jgi:hypothetical protein
MESKYPRSDFHIVYKHHLTNEVKWSGVQFQKLYMCYNYSRKFKYSVLNLNKIQPI